MWSSLRQINPFTRRSSAFKDGSDKDAVGVAKDDGVAEDDEVIEDDEDGVFMLSPILDDIGC